MAEPPAEDVLVLAPVPLATGDVLEPEAGGGAPVRITRVELLVGTEDGEAVCDEAMSAAGVALIVASNGGVASTVRAEFRKLTAAGSSSAAAARSPSESGVEETTSSASIVRASRSSGSAGIRRSGLSMQRSFLLRE